MGMLVQGLNLIRDLWNTLHDAGELGTGNTAETGQDTDLETVLASSESTETVTTKTSQMLKKEVFFNGTSAGGQIVKELIWKTSSPEKAGSRVTFTDTTWATNGDLRIESRWFWAGRRG